MYHGKACSHAKQWRLQGMKARTATVWTTAVIDISKTFQKHLSFFFSFQLISQRRKKNTKLNCFPLIPCNNFQKFSEGFKKRKRDKNHYRQNWLVYTVEYTPMSSLSVFNIMNSQPPEYFPKQIFSIQQLELNCFQGYIPVYGHTCVICIHIYIYACEWG